MENTPPTLTDSESKIAADIKAESLEKQLSEKYNEEFILLLRRLVYELAVVGLPINEACTYVGIDSEKFQLLLLQDPLINQLIQAKDLEYKRNLLKTVSEKAKTDDKMSLWLLERKYPAEFASGRNRKNGDGPGDADLLGMAVEFIQKSGDNNPLVTEKSGKITIIKRTSTENKEFTKSLESILN